MMKAAKRFCKCNQMLAGYRIPIQLGNHISQLVRIHRTAELFASDSHPSSEIKELSRLSLKTGSHPSLLWAAVLVNVEDEVDETREAPLVFLFCLAASFRRL